ncbi:MAG: acetylglucosamine-6-sulfatase [Phycisphaerae bacterium SG8_4]|nr:MAG: acetylglucosamine-6-sulfatase [Phycisphaerae bacterium SG8_4]
MDSTRRAFLKTIGTGAASLALSQYVHARASLRRDNRPNVILVLTDDHRFDAMGFVGHPFLETPHMDRMAREGVHLANAFVTTSLCSPSRASILTGQYAHNHGVVDNYNPVPESLRFFPEYLQKAGYETAFVGKWHMGGEHDEPQRGFDYWLSFKGQGTYWADGHGTSRVVPQTSYDGFNIDGTRVPQRGYITDELTDYALAWLSERTDDRPYMLFLSHKAVHSDFVPADRHRGRYASKAVPKPTTLEDTDENYKNKPMWLKNQRNSRHGVDFAYNLNDFDLSAYYRRYCEALLAVDENLGRILRFLEDRNELKSTVIIYAGDNGFQFGEHGLIDKRTAYEASVRIPLLVMCPDRFRAGLRVRQMVANIDIAPTILELAGTRLPDDIDGKSFVPLLRGEQPAWRDALLYEYYWERNYPHTPTTHAILTDRYKFIRYHGIWDLDELYDVQSDPEETKNLIAEPSYAGLAEKLRKRLFEMLEETNGLTMNLAPDRGRWFPWRHRERATQGKFPPSFFEPPPD